MSESTGDQYPPQGAHMKKTARFTSHYVEGKQYADDSIENAIAVVLGDDPDANVRKNNKLNSMLIDAEAENILGNDNYLPTRI